MVRPQFFPTQTTSPDYHGPRAWITQWHRLFDSVISGQSSISQSRYVGFF